ncbi:hypothetical protein BDN70DRAFT_920278 [Pholiota conissans]|uniref:F-box domain-containing protein n=1 Tax=Pholiota conissans TaxID=109636 RepID=A0A9P5Z5W8_9AGAR|nr:hypothetical protein BDN70DRAFT_920278 [Pholiota conissans]
MPPHSASGPGSTLPPEIIDIICCDPLLEIDDLHNLRSVSNAFRERAELVLYRSVELREPTKLRAFCITVVGRPSLALCLRKLVLHLVPQQDIDPDDLSRMVKMLRLSKNLRSLFLLNLTPWNSNTSQNEIAIHNWILDGHEFKLTTFMNSYFVQTRLKKFLETQSELETLILPCNNDIGLRNISIPSLKNLSSLAKVIPELLKHGSTMNLERLQILLLSHTPESFFTKLNAQLSGRLRCLSIPKYECLKEGDFKRLVVGVATHWRAIEYLEIGDYIPLTENVFQSCSFPSKAMFTHIKKLVLHIQSLTEERQLSISTEIMDALPTLKRLVLTKLDSGYQRFQRRAYQYERNGEIHFSEYDNWDPNEWLSVRF